MPLSPLTYEILKHTCILGVLGRGISVYRAWVIKKKRFQTWQQYSLLALGAALLFAFLMAVAPLLSRHDNWAPQGRYLFPAIWPIAIFLVLGWAQLTPGRGRAWMLVGLSIGAIVLDYTALCRMAGYFYGA